MIYTGDGLDLAQKNSDGWFTDHLSDNVVDPFTGEANVGFCDGSVRNTIIVVCFSSNQGLRVLWHDLSSGLTLGEDLADATPGAGGLAHLVQMGDGSVRIGAYNPQSRQLTITSSDNGAAGGSYTSLPAVQLPQGTDCADLDMYMDPDVSNDGMADECLAYETTTLLPAVQLPYLELTVRVQRIEMR